MHEHAGIAELDDDTGFAVRHVVERESPGRVGTRRAIATFGCNLIPRRHQPQLGARQRRADLGRDRAVQSGSGRQRDPIVVVAGVHSRHQAFGHGRRVAVCGHLGIGVHRPLQRPEGPDAGAGDARTFGVGDAAVQHQGRPQLEVGGLLFPSDRGIGCDGQPLHIELAGAWLGERTRRQFDLGRRGIDVTGCDRRLERRSDAR